MARKRTIDDSVLGHLKHVVGDLWEAPVSVMFCEKMWDISLSIRIDEQCGIEQEQQKAYGLFVENQEVIMLETQSKLREYAKSHGVKNVDGASLLKNVRPTKVFIPYASQSPTLGILFDAKWDMSHGAAVKYVDGRLVEVGQQDIVL